MTLHLTEEEKEFFFVGGGGVNWGGLLTGGLG